MGVGVWVPLLAAVIAAVVSFVSGLVLARYKAGLDAHVQYELEARKRLYAAVGPLRYQLVVACREAAARIEQMSHRAFLMDATQDYGRNTLYRLLRPLAIAELIERQTNYVDFGVDPGVLRMVRFEAAAFAALTGERALRGLDESILDWTQETQHVFKGRLQQAAAVLIVDDPPRCARFAEFEQAMNETKPDDHSPGGLHSLARLLESLWPNPKPAQEWAFAPTTNAAVFWLRLVSYGYVCNWLISQDGATAGIAAMPYPVTELVSRAGERDVHPIAGSLLGLLDELIGSAD